jgi:hypothetical protein
MMQAATGKVVNQQQAYYSPRGDALVQTKSKSPNEEPPFLYPTPSAQQEDHHDNNDNRSLSVSQLVHRLKTIACSLFHHASTSKNETADQYLQQQNQADDDDDDPSLECILQSIQHDLDAGSKDDLVYSCLDEDEDEDELLLAYDNAVASKMASSPTTVIVFDPQHTQEHEHEHAHKQEREGFALNPVNVSCDSSLTWDKEDYDTNGLVNKVQEYNYWSDYFM